MALAPGERRLPRAYGFNPDPELLKQWSSRAIHENFQGGSSDPDVFGCASYEEKLVQQRSRCGADRDCIPDDRENPFYTAYCNALAWCSLGNGRFVEIWNKEGTRRLLLIKEKTVNASRVAKCQAKGLFTVPQYAGSEAEPDPFTITVPGVSDIIRIPGIESKALRGQRAARMRNSHSALPQGLAWIPPLLNKLDDAQDILFTALAVGAAAARWLGFRMIPGLGVALAVNDIANAFT